MANHDSSAPEPKRPDPPPPPAPRPTGPLTRPGARRVPPVIEAAAPIAPNLPAEPVADGETVSLTIDGHAVTVRKGTNVLEAAKLLGKDICHFCYHPGLTIAASCRQCLVEVEKMPKLQPSCQLPVGEGMSVRTESPAVLKARQEMLEFTLKNHPIDCPICDKAGECVLQRHYMAHDHSLTRVDVAKIRKPKHKDIGREIVLDAERCILCSRCTRFCEEIPKTAELTMAFRGDHQQVDISPGHRIDNAYSVNVVDICPVGALTAKDFRFKVRAWELTATDTTCPGCATGCAVELHTRHEEAYRLLPRHDPAVNGHWMCDEGRYTYTQLASADRIRHARVDAENLPLRQALTVTARRLADKKAAVVLSATATNEANAAAAELARLLGAERFVLARPRGEGDDILRDPDKNPNLRGALIAAGEVLKHEAELALELAGRAYGAVVFVDGEAELSEVALDGLREVVSICLADRHTPLGDACTIALPATNWAETTGSYFNRQGRLRMVQAAWRPEGDRRDRADLLRDLMLAMGGEDARSGRDRARALAHEHKLTELLRVLEDEPTTRPTLLRFGHSRG